MTYYIAKIREYFADQNNLKGASLVTDDNGFGPLEFDSIADCRDKIEELDDEIYVTSNGEAWRPTYYIVDEDCRAWLESDDGSKYDWDDYDGADDDDDAQYVYAREQDERYVEAHAIDPDDADERGGALMKLKIDRATGAAVELHRFDQIKWQSFISAYHGLDFAAAKKELDDAIQTARDCDDDAFSEAYEAAREDLAALTCEEFVADGCEAYIFAEGREIGWKICEEVDNA